MQTFYFQKTSELKRTKSELEKVLGIKIGIVGRKVSVTGTSLNEYEASLVLRAINFGFSTKKALSLRDENFVFQVLNIKDFTRKKNLKIVRARIIGEKGRTKKTIESISNCEIMINDNEIGIIASADDMGEIITAITNLIRGTKQANTYRYLEKINRLRRKSDKN